MAAFFSPRASFTVNNGAPAVGRSEIAELAQSFMTTFPDLLVIMDDVRVREDHAEYHWTLIGTNTGPGGTGHRVRISGLERWQIGTDGLIAASQGQFDASDYRCQLEHGVQEPQ